MRILNRFLAFILALALLAVSVIVIVEVISYAINRESLIVDWMSWQRWAERTHFNSTQIKVVSIILIVVGLVLLLAELKPRRVTHISLQSDDAATDTAITTKGIAVVAKAATVDVDGVSDAAASAGHCHSDVRREGQGRRPSPDGSRDHSRANPLGLVTYARRPRLSVRVKPRSR